MQMEQDDLKPETPVPVSVPANVPADAAPITDSHYVLTAEQEQAVARLQLHMQQQETIGIRPASHPYIVLRDGEPQRRCSNFALAAEIALEGGIAWQVQDTAQQPPRTYSLTACRLRLDHEIEARKQRRVEEFENAKKKERSLSRFRNGSA